MKKILVFTLLFVCAFSFVGAEAMAQNADSDAFTLEEITVTAEKREVAVQDLPSSVAVLEGASIVQQGKISTKQILESLPNVKWEGKFANANLIAATPDAGIAIRGVRYKQTSDGQPPAATATYVDGVFQGIGSNYDINRVEVLRGPQGTLYGRSATGGVVAFHTNNPKLGEFGGSASAEIGEANLMNFQAALNLPYGDEIAVRLAGHHYERDGYYNPDGGYARTSEGRIKALWQPTEVFDIMLTAALTDRQVNSGGFAARLTGPDTIDYKDTVTEVAESGIRRSLMYALTANYDFGPSILTYIASYRHYEDEDSPYSVVIRPGSQVMHNQFFNYGENFYTHEARLASNTDGRFKWQIGANHYKSDFDRYQISFNHQAFISTQGGIPDPDPATVDAPIFEKPTKGGTKNFGIFTEESFDVSNTFRITAGLRYDATEVTSSSAFNLNANENENFNKINPANWILYSRSDTIDFSNVTYKLRFEYDLTPSNMLYALTATGFQPGDLRLTTKRDRDTGTFTFPSLPYDEEKLTSYEVGSKNRFLNERLQLNLSAFFYDYEGYRYTVNTNTGGGGPIFAVLPIPLEIKGAELGMEWLLTANDKVTLNTGYLDAKITGYPDIPGLNPTSQYMVFKRVPGIPELTANLGYDHTFVFPNGSMLVPRGEVRFTKGMYIENLTEGQFALGDAPYVWQDDYYIFDIGATWTSPNGMFSATAYVRNLFDEEYKNTVTVSGGPDSIGVDAGDPQAWGLVLKANF